MSEQALDQHWMRHALALAHHAAEQGEVPVGAVIVANGIVIGEGWNQPISSCDPTAHAEVVALRDAGRRLQNYRLPETTLYVTIEPCTMCAGSMIHARVGRVIYGATEPKSGVVASNPCIFEGSHFNHKIDYLGGVLAEQCAELMSSFFRRRRKQRKVRG